MLTLTDCNSCQTIDITGGAEALPVGFLRENGSYRIEFEGLDNRDVSLLISDEEMLPTFKEMAQGRTRVRWDWNIEEYAGEAVLSLLDGQGAFVEYVLDIAPNPYKLGSEVYRELLLDLQEKAEGLLFGTTPAQGLLQHQEANVPPIARFVLLRSYLPALERAFRTMEQAPHRSLVAEREERPLHKVRRVDTHSLQTALKRMPVLAALKNRQRPGKSEIATLDVPRRDHTHDTSPNRHTVALLFRLCSICSDLCKRFEKVCSTLQKEPDFRRRAERWYELSQRFQKKVMRMRRTSFLAEVKPAKPDAAALLAIARHPAYSQFDRIARRILFPRVALGGDADKKLCLRNTYDIYEYWCFFTVVDAMKSALPDVTWKSTVGISAGDLLLNLEDGSSLDGTHEGANISVVFQRHYNKNQDQSGLFSMSRSCIPDIVVTIQKQGTLRTIIFDAKYRSSLESIHAALSDMHVYRDAIRTEDDKPAIEAAFILTPAHHADLERYYTAEYQERFNFGGFDLQPGNQGQQEVLVKAIRRMVKGTRTITATC